jgi:hypothetical protein
MEIRREGRMNSCPFCGGKVILILKDQYGRRQCAECTSEADAYWWGKAASKREVDKMREVIEAAIEVAYDPGRQPNLVLTLIDLGFINLRPSEVEGVD